MIVTEEIHYRGGKIDSSTDFDRNSSLPMNLILCLDGTQNEFGYLPFSNSLRFFQLLDKDNPQQLSYYQPGVGVKFTTSLNDHQPKNIINSNVKSIGRTLDSIFAFTFEIHVKAAYIFLMKYYKPGDNICLIGFSRGSFAARILSGMIESVGLLNKGLEDMVNTAWEIYCNWENAGQPNNEDYATNLVIEFRKIFCRSKVKIHFMGLFDTVNSVGLIKDKLFPYTSKSSIVEHVRHAVSLDERRGKFKQVLFETFSYFPHLTDLEYEDCYQQQQQESDNDQKAIYAFYMLGNDYLNQFTDILRKLLGRNLLKKRINDDCNCQDIKEIWFPGNHGDVGGGWNLDEGTNQSLSNMSLRWMIAQAIEFGIIFKPKSIREFNLNYPNISTFLSSNHDILSFDYIEIIDKFKNSKKNNYDNETKLKLPEYPILGNSKNGNISILEILFWWIIELLPIGIKIEDESGQWKNIYIPNFGRSRKLPKDVNLHWSVFYRLHYFKDYLPENLPKDLSNKFLNAIKFMNFKDWEKYELFAKGLNIDKIKNSWNSKIWDELPDDLDNILKHHPEL